MLRADRVQLRENRVLDLEVFENGFDHEVAIREILDVCRGMQAGETSLILAGGEFAALDGFPEKGRDLLAGTLEGFGSDVEDAGDEARACTDDRDACSHGAAADDADGLDVAH